MNLEQPLNITNAKGLYSRAVKELTILLTIGAVENH